MHRHLLAAFFSSVAGFFSNWVLFCLLLRYRVWCFFFYEFSSSFLWFPCILFQLGLSPSPTDTIIAVFSTLFTLHLWFIRKLGGVEFMHLPLWFGLCKFGLSLVEGWDIG